MLFQSNKNKTIIYLAVFVYKMYCYINHIHGFVKIVSAVLCVVVLAYSNMFCLLGDRILHSLINVPAVGGSPASTRR